MDEKNDKLIPRISSDLMSSDMLNVLDAIDREEKIVAFLNRLPVTLTKLTTPEDWSNQGGKPYLEGHAVMRIARRFKINLEIMERYQEPLEDGYFSYGYKIRASGQDGSFVESEGYRDSSDSFFCTRWKDGQKTKLPHKEVEVRNVRQSALTHAKHNALQEYLGIGAPKWEWLAGAWGCTVEEAKAKAGGDVFGGKKSPQGQKRSAPPPGTQRPPETKRPPQQEQKANTAVKEDNGRISQPQVTELIKGVSAAGMSNEDFFGLVKKSFNRDITKFTEILKTEYDRIMKGINKRVDMAAAKEETQGAPAQEGPEGQASLAEGGDWG